MGEIYPYFGKHTYGLLWLEGTAFSILVIPCSVICKLVWYKLYTWDVKTTFKESKNA